jgi:GABA permease
MSEKARVLVVANRTAASDELLEALVQRVERGSAEFFLVVPATPRGASWITDMNSASGESGAEEALARALARWKDVGIDAMGRVGDSDPLAAASDAAGDGEFDEVIVSTLPKHVSKWLHLDLPHKVAHATGLPTDHVRAHEAKATA